MFRVGMFEKVSLEQFALSILDSDSAMSSEQAAETYQNLQLPTRATAGSAGYDFVSPISFMLSPGSSIKIPTGIRVRIDEEGWMLGILPRSSLGFKHRMQLDNTMGVIDSDYYHATNEGHIFIKVTNDGSLPMAVAAGDRFAQGIFFPYGITHDDYVDAERTGGMGSTGN